MTLIEAKDHIAKSHNYENWYDLQSKVPPAECYWHLEQVAELYARSKWSEAAFESLKLNYDKPLYTEPEFKP